MHYYLEIQENKVFPRARSCHFKQIKEGMFSLPFLDKLLVPYNSRVAIAGVMLELRLGQRILTLCGFLRAQAHFIQCLPSAESKFHSAPVVSNGHRLLQGF